jgi:hypothetical protein
MATGTYERVDETRLSATPARVAGAGGLIVIAPVPIYEAGADGRVPWRALCESHRDRGTWRLPGAASARAAFYSRAAALCAFLPVTAH